MSSEIPNPAALGITEKEALIYEFLLHQGEQDAATIILETNLKRPTTYKALHSLISKGLVLERPTTDTTLFRPQPPAKLLEISQRQFQELEKARADLQTIIPMLAAAYSFSTERPVVSIFEGVRGIKQVFEDTLNEGAEILAVVQAGEVDPNLASWLESHYVIERVRRNIHAKVIVASSSGNLEYTGKDQQQLRSTILLPQHLAPFKHEVNIYGTKVAFINYVAGEKLLGIIINQPRVADTMRAMFELAWLGGITHTRDNLRN